MEREMKNRSFRIVRVARDGDLFEQIGRDIHFDIVDHDRVRAFHVPKQMPFSLFKEKIAEEFGIVVQFQRFWIWRRRKDHTYRPLRPLSLEEESKAVGELREVDDIKRTELNLFLEVELGPHHRLVPPPIKTDEDILLFFKLYIPKKEELRFVGRLFVKIHAKPTDILGKLKEMARFGPDEEIDLYEELRFKPSLLCKVIKRALTFQANRIEDGDIICFQKTLVQSAASYRYLTELIAQNHPSERFTWRVSNFSKLNSRTQLSEVFTAAGCNWQVLMFLPNGEDNHISVRLGFADYTSLPIGWSRTVNFSFTVVNQNDRHFSVTKEMSHKFTELEHECGFASFVSLAELNNQTRGFLSQDTLVVQANVAVLKAVAFVPPNVAAHDVIPPPCAPLLDPYSSTETDSRETGRFISYFQSLDEFIDAAESSSSQTSDKVPKSPSTEEVENAKQSLKQCLSVLFKLNMKERLASALSILSTAKNGLSSEQRESVLEFQAHFDDFISGYMLFEHDNSEFKLQKLEDDMLLSTMKENRKRNLCYRELSEKLAKEEEELKRKLEETRRRNAELVSDWKALMAESEEVKSQYVSKKAKLAEAEEWKRIAEERMSRSTAAWSSLKSPQFL